MKQTSTSSVWSQVLRLFGALLLLPLLGQAQSATVVISQVYTTGGSSGATYNQDFVELFNRSTTPATITGWTIQYAASTGLFGTPNNSYTLTAATIPPGGYYLVGVGTAGATGGALAPDQTTTTITSGLAAAAGKIALANNATTITYTSSNVFSANVVDVVGYGSGASAYEGSAPAGYPTATGSAASSIFRGGNGCTDTNNNVMDFASAPVSPRNAGTTASVCGNSVLVANPATLTFSVPTGQVANTATYTLAGYNLAPNTPITISSNNAAVLLSTTGAAGPFTQAASVTTTASGTLTQPIAVRFTAPATAGITTAAISNSDGTRTATVAVIGSAITAYTWNGSSPSNGLFYYSNPSNWTPARTTAANSDVLLFDGAITAAPVVTLDYASTQTVGQLYFSNNIAAILNTDGARTLMVAGNLPGDDLVIRAGSTVTVANNNSIISSGLGISLGSTETASVSGTLIFAGLTGVTNANGRHTLQATTAGAIQFLDGSRFQAASTYANSSPFGSATASANSVVFRDGARYEQFGGSTPFGTSTATVTVFEPASYFLFGASSSFPSLTNRTYGTLAYNSNSTATTSGPVTIQGDLIVLSGTVNLNITGNIILQGNLQVASGASLNFGVNSLSTVLQMSGTAAQAIGSPSFATAPVFGPNTTLAINNAAGVTLGVPLTIPGTLQLTNGLLTTTVTRSITLPATAAITYAVGSNVSFVNGPVVRPLGAPGTYSFPIGKGTASRPFTLTITASNGTTYYYRAEQFEGNPGQNTVAGATLTRVSTIRSFTVSPFATAAAAASPTAAAAPLSGFTGTATISYGSDDGVTDPAQLVVAKRTDATSLWDNIGYTGSSGGVTGTVTSDTFNSFSDFALGSTSAGTTINPLPVVLTSFGAARQADGTVQVRWATASEQHSAYFEVQRSLDGSTFAVVDKVAAKGTTTQVHSYTSLDQAAPAAKLYYRLRQVDTDATGSFSPVATLAANEAAATLSLYPNPVHTYLTVAAAGGEEAQVIDLAGRILQTTTLPASGRLSVEALPAGTYLLRVQLGGQPRVLRFTKE
jgi:hypothetical protein